jgi:alanine racemase
MADVVGTIPYELLCALSRRVPRLYLENGREAGSTLQMQL